MRLNFRTRLPCPAYKLLRHARRGAFLSYLSAPIVTLGDDDHPFPDWINFEDYNVGMSVFGIPIGTHWIRFSALNSDGSERVQAGVDPIDVFTEDFDGNDGGMHILASTGDGHMIRGRILNLYSLYPISDNECELVSTVDVKARGFRMILVWIFCTVYYRARFAKIRRFVENGFKVPEKFRRKSFAF